MIIRGQQPTSHLLPALIAQKGVMSRPRSCQIAQLAYEAMVAEVMLTPKPGLVDQRGPGSHHDLALDMMLHSAMAIRPFFRDMVAITGDREPSRALRQDLAQVGRAAERAMFDATGGANSHKGTIWIIGLLVAGAAQHHRVSQIVDFASRIARFPDGKTSELATHGNIVRRQFGCRGARGEAEDGFPNIVQHALPTLKTCLRAGNTPAEAQLNTLMTLVRHVEDTCILYRGGRHALERMQCGAKRVIDGGGASTEAGIEQLLCLDGIARTLDVSPGGSADLLAGTIFLSNFREDVQ